MDVKVSVVLLSYCHEKYIEAAIESIFRQETDFKYEIILADDFSRDRTRELLGDFTKSHPADYIFSFTDKNRGAKNNIYQAVKKCKGKYIAFLEGDDFWTDNTKLQKQSDFLDANPQYSMVTHKCSQMNGDGIITEVIAQRFCPDIEVYKKEDLVTVSSVGHSSSIMLRNKGTDFTDFLRYLRKVKYCPGDCSIPMYMLQYGDIYILKENMSSYRYVVTDGGTNWSSKHNFYRDFLFFYMIAWQQEMVARKCHIKLDLFTHKCRYFTNGAKTMIRFRSVRQLVSCCAMFLFTFHRIKLLRFAIKDIRENKLALI